jgi:hypothetical protein
MPLNHNPKDEQMKSLALMCLGLFLLGAQSSVHAQVHACGGPSPGEVVVGQTEASNGIASTPLCRSADEQGAQNSETVTLHWESRWGAIAADGVHGVLGTAHEMTSKTKAQDVAIANCKSKGGSLCELKNTYANSCGAMIVGETGFNVGSANTLKEAIQNGMKVCQDTGAADCHVYFSDCSSPALVR